MIVVVSAHAMRQHRRANIAAQRAAASLGGCVSVGSHVIVRRIAVTQLRIDV
jgi:hypothetical protein